MDGCLPKTNGREESLIQKEAGAGDVAVQIESATAAKKERSRLFSPALIASLVLTSLLGIAGFIMAAWATNELKTNNETTVSLTSAILVTNTSQIPSGYGLIANMFRGTGYWAERPPILYYRSDHGVAGWNGAMYIVGGLSSNAAGPTILNNLVKYDPVYNATVELAPMPEPRARFGWAVIENKLYVFGGYNNIRQLDVLGTTLIYDFPSIYAAGGYNSSFDTLDSIEVFDPATGAWSLVANTLKTGRGDCGAAVSGNQLYVMGGTIKFQPPGVDCGVEWYKCYRFSAAAERFNPATGLVEVLSDMRNARGDFGVVESSPGRILVAGGEYNDTSLGVSRLIAQPWVEEYDVAADFWTSKAPLPDSQFRFSMAKEAGQVYAFGGQPSCPSPDQTSDGPCFANGLKKVLTFVDVNYPNVYLATRT